MTLFADIVGYVLQNQDVVQLSGYCSANKEKVLHCTVMDDERDEVTPY